MTTLGISPSVAPSEVGVTFRRGWLQHLKLGLSSAGGAAIVLGLFELLRSQPEGFRLLTAWGPWPVVVLVALAFLGKFLSRISDSIDSAFGAVVASVRQGADAQRQSADAQSRTADALSKLAVQGSRHAQEVERLTVYAVQEFPLLHERLDKQDQVLGSLGDSLSEIHTLLRGGKKGDEDAG